MSIHNMLFISEEIKSYEEVQVFLCQVIYCKAQFLILYPINLPDDLKKKTKKFKVNT